MKYNKENNTIETERLLLRLFTQADADIVTEYCNNYEMTKYLLNLPYPYTKDDAVNWINTHKENREKERLFTYAITNKQTDEFIGCISVTNNKEMKHGEIGYWIGQKHWNKGYATEATKALIEFAFKIVGLHRVYARHLKGNPASGEVMKKCGLTYEGELVDHIYKDILLYGLEKKK